jgi:hypothetical protein
MTIQEAIKSGKPFKLPHMKSFIITGDVNGKGYLFFEDSGVAIGIFETELLLSNEWLVGEPPENVINFASRRRKLQGKF